jgi:hypothetical protein
MFHIKCPDSLITVNDHLKVLAGSVQLQVVLSSEKNKVAVHFSKSIPGFKSAVQGNIDTFCQFSDRY